MSKVCLHGIPNCDTVRKARRWLEGHGIDCSFHDYKKQGINSEKLGGWVNEKGWQALLSRRGTTFRKLSDEEKADIDAVKAVALMEAHPSMIKRPVLERDGLLLVGFDPDEWEAALS